MNDDIKIARAFGRLEEQGLIARSNYLCCMNCGCHAIAEEAKDLPEKTGYVFWHEQDQEAAERPGMGLHLRYGSTKDDSTDEEAVEVGRKIVAALEAEQIDVEWDENPMKTIILPNVVLAAVERDSDEDEEYDDEWDDDEEEW